MLVVVESFCLGEVGETETLKNISICICVYVYIYNLLLSRELPLCQLLIETEDSAYKIIFQLCKVNMYSAVN